MGFKEVYGIWSNIDTEIAISKKQILVFERCINKSRIRVYEILENNTVKDNSQVSAVFGIKVKANIEFCESGKAGIIYNNHDKIEKWGDEITYDCSFDEQECIVKEVDDGFLLSRDSEIIFMFKNNKVIIRSLFSGLQELQLLEKITICEFKKGETANPENIGYCLKSWELMSFNMIMKIGFICFVRTNERLLSIQFINSDDKQLLYCRTGNYKYSNKGTVSRIGIRLLKETKKFSYRLPKDIFAHNNKQIKIDEQKFSEECFVHDKKERILYWSLKSFTEDQIVLNGCSGDYYKYNRPSMEAPNCDYIECNE